MKRLIPLIFLSTLFFASCDNGKNKYDATGSFEAKEIIVSAEAAGKILNFNVEEGDILKQGQQIGNIDSTQIMLQKESVLANASGMKAQKPNVNTQTAAVQEQIKTLENEKNRVQNLISANAANRKQLDDINAQIEVLRKQLNAQTSALQKNNSSISAQSSALVLQAKQLSDRIIKSRILSPINGVVLNKYAEVGELAQPGTPLFKIADTQNMILRAYVTNDQLAQIKLYQNVKVWVDSGDGKMKSYDGVVTWISAKSEFTPKTVQTKNERANLVYAVKIAVKNDGLLKIGMYGEVEFANNDKQ